MWNKSPRKSRLDSFEISIELNRTFKLQEIDMMNIRLIVYVFLLTTAFEPSFASKAVAEIPEPECLTNYGSDSKTACGYNCEKSFIGGKVACAEWPEGKCEAGYDTVACGPPAPDNWHEKYDDSSDCQKDSDSERLTE